MTNKTTSGNEVKGDLDVRQLLKRIAELEKSQDAMRSLHDKGQLHRAEEGLEKKEPQYRLRLWDDKVITEILPMSKNNVRFFSRTGEDVEQVFSFITEDGKQYDVDLKEYNDNYILSEYIEAVETSTKKGQQFVTLEFRGKQYTVDIRFVN